MAVRVKEVRRSVAHAMDMFGDAANVAILLAVVIASWKCWSVFLDLYQRVGGVSGIPRTSEGWKTFGYSVYMMLQDDFHRAALWKGVQNWSLAWIAFIMAVAFTLLAIAGLRWVWIRARDIVAGV
jgi:TRAP-type C4-dicarboxylate transport system permease small subunit